MSLLDSGRTGDQTKRGRDGDDERSGKDERDQV